MNYDEFEATMQDAGWTLNEIERMWTQHRDEEVANDTWPAEEWDRD